MQRPLNNAYNVGEETWLPAPADNRITNYDLATRAGQYSRFPGAQGPFERFDLTRTSATAFSGPTGSRRSPSTDTPSPGSSCKWEGEGKGEAASGFPLPSRAIGLPISRWPGPHTPARDSKPSTEGSAATRVCQAAFYVQHPEQEEAGPVERIPVSKQSASRAAEKSPLRPCQSSRPDLLWFFADRGLGPAWRLLCLAHLAPDPTFPPTGRPVCSGGLTTAILAA